MLEFTDIMVMAAYFTALLVIGIRTLRTQDSTEVYFLGGRSLKTPSLTVLWFASWIGGASIVATVNRAYTLGISAIWYVTALATGCLLFGLLMAARVKRLGDEHQFLTYPELMESAFDHRTRIVATITTILSFLAYAGGQLAAAAGVVSMLLDLAYGEALLITGGIVVAYTTLGGFRAITQTDWIQALLIFFGLLCIGLPIAWLEGGQPSAFHESLPIDYFEFGTWGWNTIIPMVLSIVLSFFVAMDSFTRCYAADSTQSARRAPLLAGLLILPMGLAAVWLGMTALITLPPIESGDDVLTAFVMAYFPAGIKGLMLCGVLAAIMSTADICILTAAGNVTHDLYERFINPEAPRKTLLIISMLASAIVGCGAVFLAWQMRDVIDLLVLGFTMNAAALLLPTIWAVYQWRGDATASFYSAMAGLLTVLVCHFSIEALPMHPFFEDPLWPGLVSASLVYLGILLLRQRPTLGSASH